MLMAFLRISQLMPVGTDMQLLPTTSATSPLPQSGIDIILDILVGNGPEELGQLSQSGLH